MVYYFEKSQFLAFIVPKITTIFNSQIFELTQLKVFVVSNIITALVYFLYKIIDEIVRYKVLTGVFKKSCLKQWIKTTMFHINQNCHLILKTKSKLYICLYKSVIPLSSQSFNTKSKITYVFFFWAKKRKITYVYISQLFIYPKDSKSKELIQIRIKKIECPWLAVKQEMSKWRKLINKDEVWWLDPIHRVLILVLRSSHRSNHLMYLFVSVCKYFGYII